MQIRILRRIETPYTQQKSTTEQIPGPITQTTFRRTYCSRKRLQANLFDYLSMMPANHILKHTNTGTDSNSDDRSTSDKKYSDLSRSQKLKQLRVGPFTVTKQTTNTTYKIQEDANPDNIEVTHRNHLIEYFPKEERLPPLFTNYAPPITKDNDFYKHLVQSQMNDYNSNQQRCSLDVMPFIISPLQENTNVQEMCKNHATLSPNADSGIQSPSTPTNDDHNYQNLTISPLPPLQTLILPMTPMSIRAPTISRTTPQFHEAEQSTSSSPKKKNKVADLTSKVKAKYKRSHPNSSLRDLERKGYKDWKLLSDYNRNTYK